VLHDAVLDRIDEIVPPGTNVYSAGIWVPPDLSDDSSRRRPVDERAAA
jgi:hypothetical protein